MWQLVKEDWTISSSTGVDFLPQGTTVNFQYDLIWGYFFCLSLMTCYKMKFVSKLHLITHIYLQMSRHLEAKKKGANSLISEKKPIIYNI